MNHDRLKKAIRAGRVAAETPRQPIGGPPYTIVTVETLNLLLKAAKKELQRT